MDMQIGRLIPAYLNPELRDFLKRREAFDSARSGISAWARFLRLQAQKRLGLDLLEPGAQLEWPMLARLACLEKRSGREPSGALTAGVEKMDVLLTQKGFRDTAFRAWIEDQGQARGRVRFDDQDLVLDMESTLGFVSPADPGLKDVSEGLAEAVSGRLWESEIDSTALVHEMEKLSDLVAVRLTRNSVEQKVVKLLRKRSFLKKLFALELTPEEYEALRLRPSSFSPEAVAAEALRVNRPGRVKNLSFEHTEEIRGLFGRALDFYALVHERDLWMLEKTERLIAARKARVSVIVTGGFHAGAFRDFFEKRSYAYALVAPAIKHVEGRETYLKTMFYRAPLWLRSGLESAMASHGIRQRRELFGETGILWLLDQELRVILNRAGGSRSALEAFSKSRYASSRAGYGFEFRADPEEAGRIRFLARPGGRLEALGIREISAAPKKPSGFEIEIETQQGEQPLARKRSEVRSAVGDPDGGNLRPRGLLSPPEVLDAFQKGDPEALRQVDHEIRNGLWRKDSFGDTFLIEKYWALISQGRLQAGDLVKLKDLGPVSSYLDDLINRAWEHAMEKAFGSAGPLEGLGGLAREAEGYGLTAKFSNFLLWFVYGMHGDISGSRLWPGDFPSKETALSAYEAWLEHLPEEASRFKEQQEFQRNLNSQIAAAVQKLERILAHRPGGAARVQFSIDQEVAAIHELAEKGAYREIVDIYTPKDSVFWHYFHSLTRQGYSDALSEIHKLRQNGLPDPVYRTALIEVFKATLPVMVQDADFVREFAMQGVQERTAMIYAMQWLVGVDFRDSRLDKSGETLAGRAALRSRVLEELEARLDGPKLIYRDFIAFLREFESANPDAASGGVRSEVRHFPAADPWSGISWKEGKPVFSPAQENRLAWHGGLIPYALYERYPAKALEAIGVSLAGPGFLGGAGRVSAPGIFTGIFPEARAFDFSEEYRSALVASLESPGSVLLDEKLLGKFLKNPRAVFWLLTVLNDAREYLGLKAPLVGFVVNDRERAFHRIRDQLLKKDSGLDPVQKNQAARYAGELERLIAVLETGRGQASRTINGYARENRYGVATLLSSYNGRLLPGANLVLDPSEIHDADALGLTSMVLSLIRAARLTRGIDDARVRYASALKALPDIFPGARFLERGARAFMLSKVGAYLRHLAAQRLIQASA